MADLVATQSNVERLTTSDDAGLSAQDLGERA
jgi:hypothetical protein